MSTMKLLQKPTRHLFFTGKGGVGKTSLSCATAIALADQLVRAGEAEVVVAGGHSGYSVELSEKYCCPRRKPTPRGRRAGRHTPVNSPAAG